MILGNNMTSLLFLAALTCFLQHVLTDSTDSGVVQQTSSLNSTQYAFGVAVGSSISYTADGRLSLPLDVANANGWYRHATDDFVSRSSGLYFLYICVGVQPYSTVYVQQAGGYPRISYTWQSTNHSGIVLGCRSGIARLTKGVAVGMNFLGGNIFSDSQLETSFSAFSISDAMTSSGSTLFVSSSLAVPFNTQGANIPFGCRNAIFVNPLPSSAIFNAATYTYTCLTAGYYLVSISVGINAGQSARVALISSDSTNNTNFELTHNTKQANGLVTVSRSVLIPSSAGSSLQLALTDGEIWSGPNTTACEQNLISWSVIRYSPVSHLAAWAVYYDRVPQYPSGSGTHTLNFNVATISDGASYDGSTVTLSYSGAYMIYLSAATSPGRPLNLVAKRNNDVLPLSLQASVTASDGSQMMEHGIIIQLSANDKLSVVIADGTTFYSDSGLQVGFWGFLIYST